MPALESPENLRLMRLIDEQYLATPFYGSRRMAAHLARAGHAVNRKRVQRLMRQMGLEGPFPGRKTTISVPGHKVYPYLLRGLSIGYRTPYEVFRGLDRHVPKTQLQPQLARSRLPAGSL